jgi:bifunctional polynucleotide phosphatase/kinase
MPPRGRRATATGEPEMKRARGGKGEEDDRGAAAGSSSAPWKWVESDDGLLEYLPARGQREPSSRKGALCQWLEGATRVIGFDMDSTLIDTKSGATFPKNAGDWVFWPRDDPSLQDIVPTTLRRIVEEEGARIVIFSNQAGIEKNKVTADSVQNKIVSIQATLGLSKPFPAFLASGTNRWRKPHSSMWERLAFLCRGEREPDDPDFGYVGGGGGGGAIPAALTSEGGALYVGDAAGRLKEWAPGKKKDFSASDRAFALNSGVAFQTPEEFFLGEAPVPAKKWAWSSVSQSALQQLAQDAGSAAAADIEGSGAPELVVLVGSPASGKSTLSRRYFVPKAYERVNRDTLKTKEKCWKAAREALQEGKSVVVDNTNPSAADREVYVKMARAAGVKCRCLWLQTDRQLAGHLNTLREVTHGVRRIPDVGFNMFKKNFQKPTAAEGFDAIVEVPFVPEFDDGKDAMTKDMFVHQTG